MVKCSQRTKRDSMGICTFINKNGSCLIDLPWGNLGLIDSIKYFREISKICTLFKSIATNLF